MNQISILQKAIFTALDGDVMLSSMVEGVFNHVPQNTDYPYVVMSVSGSGDVSSIASEKHVVRVVLNIYSDQQGAKEALAIAAEIHRILHQQSLTLDAGYVLEMLQVRDTDVQRISRGDVWLAQVAVEARILVE